MLSKHAEGVTGKRFTHPYESILWIPEYRTGQDRTGQDRTGQDRTGQDRTGQDRTGQDRTGQDRQIINVCYH